MTLTVQWQPPQYDGGVPVNYTITVSPDLSPVTTSGTSVPVTVPYNVIHTVSIVATNCNGTSSAAMETILSIGIGMLTLPNPLDNHTLLFSLQSTVVIPLFLKMAPLGHTRTHWRELRYSSNVTQGLSQLGEWGQCVEQMEDGTLTLLLLCAHVS